MSKTHVLMVLVACVSLFSAEPQQNSAGKKLVGTWRLVSVEGTDPTFHFSYDHPTGILIYDASGWMSVQIDVKGTRKPFVNGPAAGTDEEKMAAFNNYIAYYGTYSVDLKAQAHQIGAEGTISDGLSFKTRTTCSLFPAKTAGEE